MRNVLLFAALTLALTPAFAQAQEKRLGAPVQTIDKTDKQRVDELFVELKRSGNEAAARRVANRITERWNNSGSASVDLMMQWANKAIEDKKWDVALDFLDQVTVMRPEYAEGWNRRATAHFMMNNFAKSMSDIERTLRIEPRHFGALAGMAQMLKARGNKEMALAIYTRILDVYPAMREAQIEVGSISEELAGETI